MPALPYHPPAVSQSPSSLAEVEAAATVVVLLEPKGTEEPIVPRKRRATRETRRADIFSSSLFFRDFDRSLWRLEVVVSNARRFSGFLYPSIHSIISLVHSFLRAVYFQGPDLIDLRGKANVQR